MTLWSGADFVAAVGGRLAGAVPDAITGISIDSRTVAPGEAFFAIRGDRFDGHDYVGAALAAGASVAVVTEGRVASSVAAGGVLRVPDDPLAGLERLAVAGRKRSGAQVAAVTGSVGKTSTKEMLRTAFSGLGATHAPVGSFNNHWGVPLTLARMPAETRFGIFEIGMNHSGEIRPLTAMVRPHVAVITTVEPVHLANFNGEQEIAEAKAEILEGLLPGGVAVLNRDNRWFELLAGRAKEVGARILSFGEHEAADIRLLRISQQEDASSIEAVASGERLTYKLGAPGRHLAANSLAVLATAQAFGADLARVALALADFRAAKGRGERFRLAHPAGPFTLIDESYNANPASMRAALAVLGGSRPEARGRRIAVLGDMLELGPRSPDLHRGLNEAIEAAGADLVFLAGSDMASLWHDLPEERRGAYAESAAALEPILIEAVRPGDVVMIKASLGTRLGPVVEAMKRRFAPDAREGL